MNIQELETIEADWKESADVTVLLLIAEVRRLKTEMNKIATAAREAAE